MFSKQLCWLMLWLGLFISGPSMAESFKIIVNNQNDLASLNRDYLKKLYLKKTSVYPNGQRAMPAGVEIAATRNAFNSEVLNRNTASLNSYWSRLMFSGVTTPPELFASDAEAMEYVARYPEAFAFISDSFVIDNSKVKILTIK